MSYTALLLGPDDDVIAEMAVREWLQEIRVAKPSQPFRAWWAESDVMTAAPTFSVVRFFFQRRETEIYRVLRPDILIYRQEGWEHEPVYAHA